MGAVSADHELKLEPQGLNRPLKVFSVIVVVLHSEFAEFCRIPGDAP